MALINCKECGGKLSTTAMTCPHCGAPTSTAKSNAFASAFTEALFSGGPKCPVCGSSKIDKLGVIRKTGSFAVKGVFSNDFGKKYVCKKCKAKF